MKHLRTLVLLFCWVGFGLLAAGCQAATVLTPTATLSPSITPTLEISPTATMIPTPMPTLFDGERAYQDVQYQVSLGPRTPGSKGHRQLIDWLSTELQANDWQVEMQETTYAGQKVRNVIAKRGTSYPDQQPWIILGAHFDTRMWASADPNTASQNQPVPGANDGASGVAVLLELARVLPKDLDKQIWLVFFDAEDQGQIPGWDWILGSRAFAESLTEFPDAVVVVDMVGDVDLNLYYERTSDVDLMHAIWSQAASLGYGEQFIAQEKYTMLDDHAPFLERGIPAVDLIDFDYPFWHTLADTPDKVSANSLMAVGQTLQYWLDPRTSP